MAGLLWIVMGTIFRFAAFGAYREIIGTLTCGRAIRDARIWKALCTCTTMA